MFHPGRTFRCYTSCQPNRTAETFSVKYDFKGWLIENIRTPVKHTHPHAYKFERDADGNVYMFFKRFAMDDAWMKSDLPLLSHMPNGQPAIVRPTWEKQMDIKSLRDNVSRFKFLFNNEQLEHWNNFLSDLERKQT